MRETPALYKRMIQEEISRRTAKNSSYSLRAFALSCGASPGSISLILSGKRIPSHKLAQRLLAQLDLDSDGRKSFLGSLAQCHRGRGLKRMSPYFKKESPTLAPVSVRNDSFDVISDWHHYAILALTFVPGFKSDPAWIASQFSISRVQAELAIQRLLQLGLLRVSGKRLAATHLDVSTQDKSTTSAALKRRARQSLEKAMHALENDPFEERCFSYVSLAFPPEKIGEARKAFDQFTSKMADLAKSGKPTRVYEFGTYLYPLQRKEKS